MNINLTMLFQVLFFGVFVWFSKRFVWTPLIGALNARRAIIADSLAAAEKGRQAGQDGQQLAKQAVIDARAESAEIIRRAEKRCAELVEESKALAKSEGARLLESARTEIETEINKAREALCAEVGELAVAGAQRILQREIDPKAHAELLDQLAEQLTAPGGKRGRVH
ncbi:MAG: F0F1 ATP synthase subunit B [Gammaproteobacteria bacterium]